MKNQYVNIYLENTKSTLPPDILYMCLNFAGILSVGRKSAYFCIFTTLIDP